MGLLGVSGGSANRVGIADPAQALQWATRLLVSVVDPFGVQATIRIRVLLQGSIAVPYVSAVHGWGP